MAEERSTDTLTISSRLSEIDRAADFVAAHGREHGLEPATVHRLTLILEELVTNSVKHGGAGPDSPITLTLSRRGSRLALAYTDRGCAFNPLTDLPPPDLDDTWERRRIGGLGWPLIEHYCESIDYRRESGENRLELIIVVQLAPEE